MNLVCVCLSCAAKTCAVLTATIIDAAAVKFVLIDRLADTIFSSLFMREIFEIEQGYYENILCVCVCVFRLRGKQSHDR